MRSRRRVALLLASAAALGVGLIAFPASSAAAPPAVPTCTFPTTAGSDSCATLRVNAFVPPVGTAYENIKLGIRVRSQFSPATSETTSVNLKFDDDIALNLTGIPTCPASKLSGKTIAQAYDICGPAGVQSDNAFLSPAGNVSGVGSTTITGIDACTMIFKGADNTHLTVYARAPIGNPSTECNNPATNSGGSATVIFTGALTTIAAPYKTKLTVPNTQSANPALDDFSATLSRGAAFRARCPAGTSPHKLLGTLDYTAAGDANDTYTASDPCP
jgi:hypothetical protein